MPSIDLQPEGPPDLAEKGLEFVEHKLKLFQNDQLKPNILS